MKLTGIVASIMLIIQLSSCENKNDAFLIREYYNNGKLKRVFTLNKDSIPDGIIIDFYQEGNIDRIGFLKNSDLDSIYFTFYENGNIESIENYQMSKKDGYSYYFYNNGNVKTIEHYKDDLLYGNAIAFFKEDSGKISSKAEYFIVKNKEYQNYFIEYDKNGEVIYETPRTEIIYSMDSIYISLANPLLDNMAVMLGNYNQIFHLSDSSSFQRVICEGFSCSLDKNELNAEHLRGIVENYDILERDEEYIHTKSKYYIFEYPQPPSFNNIDHFQYIKKINTELNYLLKDILEDNSNEFSMNIK